MIKKYIIKYSIEFVVIILGITVSFWLNELSIDNQNEEERIKVLTSLQMEINEIKYYCDGRKRTWDKKPLVRQWFRPNRFYAEDNVLCEK